MFTEIEAISEIAFLDKLRSQLLDRVFAPISSPWYREVLIHLPQNVSVLDVGIGNASSLINNRDIVNRKNIHVTGVDYCQAYIQHARRAVAESSIAERVELICQNIHEYNISEEQLFDVAYFSASFMIIPEQAKALRHVANMLKSRKFEKQSREGNIYFTQTFEHATWLGRHITPHLKKLLTTLTTVDFGVVTFEADFRATLEQANVEIVEMRTLRSSYFRRQVLVVARSKCA